MITPIMFQGSRSPSPRPQGNGKAGELTGGDGNTTSIERNVSSGKNAVLESDIEVENRGRSGSIVAAIRSTARKLSPSKASSSSARDTRQSRSTSSSVTITQELMASSRAENETPSSSSASIPRRKLKSRSPRRNRSRDGERGRKGFENSHATLKQAQESRLVLPSQKTNREKIDDKQIQVVLRLEDYDRQREAYLRDARQYHANPNKYAKELEQIITSMVQLHMCKTAVREKGNSVTAPGWALPRTADLLATLIEPPSEAVIEKIRKQVHGLPVSPESLPVSSTSSSFNSKQSSNLRPQRSSRDRMFHQTESTISARNTELPDTPKTVSPFSLSRIPMLETSHAQDTPTTANMRTPQSSLTTLPRRHRREQPVVIINSKTPILNSAQLDRPVSQGNFLPVIPQFDPQKRRNKFLADAKLLYLSNPEDPKLRLISNELSEFDKKYSSALNIRSESPNSTHRTLLSQFKAAAHTNVTAQAVPSSPRSKAPLGELPVPKPQWVEALEKCQPDDLRNSSVVNVQIMPYLVDIYRKEQGSVSSYVPDSVLNKIRDAIEAQRKRI